MHACMQSCYIDQRGMVVSLSSHALKQQRSKINTQFFTWGWVAKASLNSWSLAIKNAASSSSSPHTALKLYAQMQRQRIPLDSFVILFTLKASSYLHNLSLIRHLHAHLLKLGFGSHVYVATSLLHAYIDVSFHDACCLFDEMPHKNTVTWNTMITAYLRSGHLQLGRTLFDEMPIRDIASWSTMISAGYINNGLWREGLALFREMMMVNIEEQDQLKPDQAMLGAILAGCGRMGSSVGLILGKTIHGFAVKNEWELKVEFGTCLVDMYAKCGYLRNACLVFDTMKDKNVVTWTALICGAAQHGFGKEALLIFERMKESGTMPNELTFTGILSACARAGLVEEGRGCFRMIEECGLRPRIEHYGCMVDLFGKAGLLGEAYEVIKTMGFEPNVVIWGSFLSSCKLHKQFEMAERVIDRVLSMVRPENDGGVYTLISDLYVLNDKWLDAQRLRTLMLNHNVNKARGSSFINTAGTI